ncbi:hypothetical protein D0861_08397 [Hortaea werneckii]|uniref:F-box domain-containing protein n=1 Tax=Hortaea werneckii TaxID=91943 RepID=A0A3M7EY24_HORWE|nr:hypothetical protein D0861_08397 [Hortaea werneckii]
MQSPDTMMDGALDQSASALLSLPPELRNEIWRCLLVRISSPSPDPKAIDRKKQRHRSPAGREPREPHICTDLLRTCRQANTEATPILYGENTFNAHPSLLATLPSFLLSTLPIRVTLPPVTHARVVRLIRKFSLHVRLDTDPRFTSFQAEESFNGVEELEIEVFQAITALSSTHPGNIPSNPPNCTACGQYGHTTLLPHPTVPKQHRANLLADGTRNDGTLTAGVLVATIPTNSARTSTSCPSACSSAARFAEKVLLYAFAAL